VSGLSREQAREEILRQLDASLTAEQSERIARHEKDLQARNKELAVEIVGRAIQRYAAEHTAETTSAKIKLADEEMKGRIIGKEGRNIKAFEQATGVDLLLDDQPGVLTISCFSGLRREMARRTLMVLLEDGRIHPGRIEEVMAKVQQDMDREVFKLGEDAAFAVEVSGLHPQLLRLLGKLQWRTSYGQNVLQHTQEVAFLCGAMAADMGLDAKLGRRCGLMHDIGKAIDHEQEGSHPELGYEALKRYGESEIVANAALAHHEGHPVLSALHVQARAAKMLRATSSALKNSKKSPVRNTACKKPTAFKLAANCASSSAAETSPMPICRSSHATSPSASKTKLLSQVKSKSPSFGN
jgi:ribonuclease Y